MPSSQEPIPGTLLDQFPEVTTVQFCVPVKPSLSLQGAGIRSVNPYRFPQGLSCWLLICIFHPFLFLVVCLKSYFIPVLLPGSCQAHLRWTLEFMSVESLLMFLPCLALLVHALKSLIFKLRLLWVNWKKKLASSTACAHLRNFCFHSFPPAPSAALKAGSGSCAAAWSSVCGCHCVTCGHGSHGVIPNCPILTLSSASEKQGKQGTNHLGRQALRLVSAASSTGCYITG